MRINFVLPSYGESGGLKVIYKYASEFSRQGHEVVLYYPLIPYNLGKDTNTFYVCLMKMKGFFIRCFHAIRKDRYNSLCKELYRPVLCISNSMIRNADATIATAWPTAYSVSALDEKKGKKYYFIQDFEIWDNYERGKDSYFLPLKKITISKWIANQLKQIGIKEEIPVITNGINTNDFYYTLRNKRDIVCLMLFHPLEKKGVNQGVKAFEIAKESCPNLKLKMFGLTKPIDLEIVCDFIENPSKIELANLYSDADIFIFPSLEEGWGLTVIEAMLSGCAVVGSNTGCLFELGINNYNALITDPGDIVALSNSIVMLYNNDDLRKKLSVNGHSTATQLMWEPSVNCFLSILSSTQ